MSVTGVVQPTAYEYHNIHEEQQHQHDTKSNEEIVYGHQHDESVSEHNGLLTTENFPDDKHTQVYFKTSSETPYNSEEQQHYEHQHYEQEQPLQQQYQPQSHVDTYRSPLVYHKLEQFFNPHDDQGDNEQYSHAGLFLNISSSTISQR